VPPVKKAFILRLVGDSRKCSVLGKAQEYETFGEFRGRHNFALTCTHANQTVCTSAAWVWARLCGV